MRASGILMPISSLPSSYGIGTLGQSAYEFADFLEQAGQTYWQILPVSPTSYGDSPYQSFSTFAGNPYLIDLDILRGDGLLRSEEYQSVDWGSDPERVDYALLYQNRFSVLRLAYRRFCAGTPPDDYRQFLQDNEDWLEDYAFYMAAKERHDHRPWTEWDPALRFREEAALARWREDLAEEIDFWRFVQYAFFAQWDTLKAYVTAKGIRIIGDIPIYVAMDSADVWANPQIFCLDEERRPIEVAGCPPDYFSETGQLWGNPVYDWDALRESGYDWWLRRVAHAAHLYDVLRMDHFRGFESFYAIPAENDTAVEGTWRKGPGMELFERIRAYLGREPVIFAEDLGIITDAVRELLARSGYPGMKILEFAFSAGQNSDYLPHNHVKNCVCYTGTHDNDTLAGWLETLNEEDFAYVMDYSRSVTREECVENLIALAWGSVADTAIAQMQDFLALGSEARINHPSTVGGNWVWRMKAGAASEDLAERIRALTRLYWR